MYVAKGNGKPIDVDVAILGAGPAGLAAACECSRLELSHRVIDREGLAQSFHEYPHNILFFSPPHEMEIADVPLPVAGGLKPTRETYLAYLRGVARGQQGNLLTWHAVERLIEGEPGYSLHTAIRPVADQGPVINCRAIVVATGLWHEPVRLDVPGSDLPHVVSEFVEPTPYFGQQVLVIGGGNSAVGAALCLAEAGAHVTLSMRRPPKNYRCGLRPFVKRDLSFAVEEGRVRLMANTVVRKILTRTAVLETAKYTGTEDLSEGTMADYEGTGKTTEVAARFVFALIGHRPDTAFLAHTLGLKLQPTGRPEVDTRTWETSRPNIFVAGSLADPSIDIVLRLREQAKQVVATIAERIHGNDCDSVSVPCHKEAQQ